MQLRSILPFTFLAACLGAPALAGDSPTEIHAHADKNKDGEVDRAEYQKLQKDVFFFEDHDKDGNLSVKELDDPNGAAAMARADRNGDGMLQLDEFLDTRARAFRRADTDQSGGLSVEEVEAAEE